MSLRAYIRGVTTDRGRRAGLLAGVTTLLLLADRDLSSLACGALIRIPGDPAREALLRALGKTGGSIRMEPLKKGGVRIRLDADVESELKKLTSYLSFATRFSRDWGLTSSHAVSGPAAVAPDGPHDHALRTEAREQAVERGDTIVVGVNAFRADETAWSARRDGLERPSYTQ